MKLLADESFPRTAIRSLREQGFEVASGAEDSAGSTDQDVLARCTSEGRILLTLDKDLASGSFAWACRLNAA